MAWKRNKYGNFTKAQHETMSRMAADGKSVKEIAKIAGCTTVSVRRSLKLNGKAKKKKKKINTQLHQSTGTGTEAAPTDTFKVQFINGMEPIEPIKEENAYLRWLVSGIINHVGSTTYVDKLIQDFSNGKFIP